MKVKSIEPNWVCYLDHPSIGSGWRVVATRRWGYKWIMLKAWGCKTNFKMTLSKWKGISKRPLYQDEYGDWKADWKDRGPHSQAIKGVELRAKRPNTKKTPKSNGKKPRKSRVAPARSEKQEA